MKLAIRMMVLGPVQTNCFFLINEDTKEVLIIDPADRAQKIIEWINSEGLKPVAILLTHGHFDHIMGMAGVKNEYHIPVYASKDEVEVLANPQLNVSTMMGAYISLTADELFADGDVLELAGMKLKVISTPGHTIGSVCFYMEEEKVLISGDTLFEASVGRSDFLIFTSTISPTLRFCSFTSLAGILIAKEEPFLTTFLYKVSAIFSTFSRTIILIYVLYILSDKYAKQ